MSARPASRADGDYFVFSELEACAHGPPASSASCGEAFCQRLHSVGYAIIELSDADASEICTLRSLAASFFAQPAAVKREVVGDHDGVGGEGVGYRDEAERGLMRG